MGQIRMKSADEILINQINRLTEYAKNHKDIFYYEALILIKEIAEKGKVDEDLYKSPCEN